MIRAPTQQTPLVEFKAGMLTKVGTTVTADDRKGILQITSDPDLDGCAKLKWLDRRSRNTLEELMIFPNDAEWVKVDQVKDGRVYVLKFKGSDRRFFFWMQEQSEEKDEEYAKAVNKALGNEAPAAEEAAATGGEDTVMATDTADDAALATESDAKDASGDAPAPMETDAAAGADAEAPPGGQATTAEMAQLASILGSATKYQHQLRDEQGIDLKDILTTETMVSLVDNPDFRESVLEHMPENAPKTPAEFKALVQSPQFKGALRNFQQALQMGQLGPVMEQFGLDGNAGALGSIQAFVDALAKHSNESKSKP